MTERGLSEEAGILQTPDWRSERLLLGVLAPETLPSKFVGSKKEESGVIVGVALPDKKQ